MLMLLLSLCSCGKLVVLVLVVLVLVVRHVAVVGGGVAWRVLRITVLSST